MAKLLRRVGRFDQGLQLLKPRLSAKPHVATIEEQIEYCMILRRLGAIGECNLRLENIAGSAKHPDALFCKVLLAMNQWEWASAIGVANRYLEKMEPCPYQMALVKLNRAGALVAMDQLDHGRESLVELVATLQIKGWRRMLSNAHELMAQILIREKKWNEAQDHLTLARSGLLSDGVPDVLFIERWRAVIAIHQTQNPEPLFKVAEKAKELGHFETLRAIDYELLCYKFNQETFDRLYFGSPYISYQSMLVKRFGSASSHYEIHAEADSVFNLATGEYNGDVLVVPGSKLSLAINSLFSDFYRPIGVGEIFENVFAGEFFSDDSSPPRVRQLVSRLRQALESTGMQIQKNPWSYKVIVPKDLKVLVADQVPRSRKEFYIQKLQSAFGNRAFTSKEAEDHIAISRASCNRLLSYGIDCRKISHTGSGPTSKYRFIELSQN